MSWCHPWYRKRSRPSWRHAPRITRQVASSPARRTGMPDQNQTDEFAYEGDDGDDDVLVLLEQIEELVREGRKVPFSSMVMVEEEEILALLHQVRSAVPREIRDAQRVVDDRAEIINAAQQEAAKILDHARSQAEYIVSEQ